MRVLTLALLTTLLMPVSAQAGTSRGAGGLTPRQWSVVATVSCVPAGTPRLCRTILGPLQSVTLNMTIVQDNPQPGITFTAIFTALGPPPPPGAGLRPFGRVCSFGLIRAAQRFIRGPFDTTTRCRTTTRGRMILRTGVATRISRTPDFWITSQTATVGGALRPRITNPLGAKAYPIDTRIPVRRRVGGSFWGTNWTLALLGIPGFPMQAVPLPRGLNASLTVSNLPLTGR